MTWDFSFKNNRTILRRASWEFKKELKCYIYNRFGGFVHSSVETLKVKIIIIITVKTEWQLSARICFLRQINVLFVNAKFTS